MTTRQQIRLKALQYPTWSSFNLVDTTQYRKVIGWLEGVVIRFYKIEDRAGLNEITSDTWLASYQQYLTDLGFKSTVNSSEESLKEALDWLLTHAINLEYQDNAAQYNADATHYLQTKGTMDVDSGLNLHDPQVLKAIRDLAAALHVPHHDDPAVLLNAVHNIVARRLSRESLSQLREVTVQLSLEDFPLGFETGDPVLDRAATVLRMLYVNDLRHLQAKINDLIATMQSLTANPKTDTAQGKLGK